MPEPKPLLLSLLLSLASLPAPLLAQDDPQPSPRVSDALGRLAAPEWSARCAAVRDLLRSSEPQGEVGAIVVGLLRDAPPHAREEILLAAGALAPEATVGTLGAMLADGAPEARAWAAGALGRVGVEAAPALESLMSALDSPDHAVRQSALGTLQQIDPERTVARLTELLRSRDPRVRRWAANGLGAFGRRARGAIPKLLSVLEEGDSATKEIVVTTLLHVDPEAAVSSLADMLRHSSQSIRHLAASRLGSLGEAARPATPALAELIRERPTSISGSEAIRTLLALDPDVVVEVLGELLEHPNWTLREQALSQLRVLGKRGRPLTPLVLEALEDGPEALRSTAARALGHVEAIETIPRLIELLEHPDVFVRKAAAQALGELGPAAAEAAPALVGVLCREESYPHRSVSRALRKISAPAVPALVDALKSEEPQARERVVSLLARMGPGARAAVPALEALVTRDRDPRVRKASEAAVKAISGEQR